MLAPLKELESRSTGGIVPLHQKDMKSSDMFDSRSNLEDMELATRALTEPLPSTQQVP